LYEQAQPSGRTQKETIMNKNSSTEAQRRFIESLAKGKTNTELEIILKPAFALYGNAFIASNTLNQNLVRISKTAASKCIEILKVA